MILIEFERQFSDFPDELERLCGQLAGIVAEDSTSQFDTIVAGLAEQAGDHCYSVLGGIASDELREGHIRDSGDWFTIGADASCEAVRIEISQIQREIDAKSNTGFLARVRRATRTAFNHTFGDTSIDPLHDRQVLDVFQELYDRSRPSTGEEIAETAREAVIEVLPVKLSEELLGVSLEDLPHPSEAEAA